MANYADFNRNGAPLASFFNMSLEGFNIISQSSNLIVIATPMDFEIRLVGEKLSFTAIGSAGQFQFVSTGTLTEAHRTSVGGGTIYESVTGIPNIPFTQPEAEDYTSIIRAAFAGNDIFEGGDRDDGFFSAAGDDTLNGRGGEDRAIFFSNRGQYEITKLPDGSVTVQDKSVNSPEGTDTLISIEKIQFIDQVYNLEIAPKAASISEASLNSLVDLYVAYFNRVPEAAGLGYWIDQLVGGKSLDAIAVEFYQAGLQFSEVTGYTADMPLSEFIGVLYENVLARTGANVPTQEEIDYWVNEVNSGQVSREELVARFLHDARGFYDDPNVGYVPELLDNKVEFGRLHATTYGIDYLTQEEAIEKTVDLAAAVTPTSIDAAVALVGLSAENYF